MKVWVQHVFLFRSLIPRALRQTGLRRGEQELAANPAIVTSQERKIKSLRAKTRHDFCNERNIEQHCLTRDWQREIDSFDP